MSKLYTIRDKQTGRYVTGVGWWKGERGPRLSKVPRYSHNKKSFDWTLRQLAKMSDFDRFELVAYELTEVASLSAASGIKTHLMYQFDPRDIVKLKQQME